MKFIPDFSLTLSEKCIYIKITRQSYIDALKLANRHKAVEVVNSQNENYRTKLLNASKARISRHQNEAKVTASKVANNVNSGRQFDIPEGEETAKEIVRMESDDETTKAYLMHNKC